jgi:signal transduction histidine kinase
MTSPVKILLVDDVGQNLIALDALLRREDVLPLHASNGAAALELLLEHDIALALIDVQMPEMDGFELAEFMRGSPRTRHVPIIFLTATDRDAKRVFKGYEAGAVDFLYKPFDPHILASKAEVFIQLHQQKRQLAAQVEAMKQLVRTNDMFVAVLGHDLRNPLSAVLMNAEILQRMAPAEGVAVAGDATTRDACDAPMREASARILKAADRIVASGQRMAQMIDQLLDVARVRSGQLQTNPEAFDLHTLAHTIVDEFQAAELPSSLSVAASGDTHGVWDRGCVSQILSNLIGNALRHGNATHPVSVEVDGSSPQEIRLRVSNGGVIPAAIQPHLFTPFRSGGATDGSRTTQDAASISAPQDIGSATPPADAANAAGSTRSDVPTHAAIARDRSASTPATAHSAGLGLGLFIVHELVRLHAGSIDARSSADKGTTTFEVTLPRHVAWRRMRDTASGHNGEASAFAAATLR